MKAAKKTKKTRLPAAASAAQSASSGMALRSWRIVPRAEVSVVVKDLPTRIVTLAPPFEHENMPAEIGLLLPVSPGPAILVDEMVNHPGMAGDSMLGLFMASPFLNRPVAVDRLYSAGLRWVANLPSIVQQDEEFSRQLTDVGLDLAMELRCLAEFKAGGFRIAAVVADRPGAVAAAVLDSEVIIVMPRISDFAAGFPSLRQRATAVQGVAEAAREAGWTGVLLGLGESREADSERLWPGLLDGLICRPEALSPNPELSG